MNQHNKGKAFFIQARTSSTRLPNKTMLPFYEGKTIVQLVIERLLQTFPDIPLVLVTTENSNDDKLVAQLKTYPISVFRGDEQNVLKRFHDAAQEYDVSDVIRICSDNPFILPEFIYELLQFDTCGYDYIAHSFEGTPSMKCHFGLFAERVQVTALEKTLQLTADPLFLEHVTNFIYSNPDSFRVNLISKTEELKSIASVRLTIDTPADFKTAAFLYEKTMEEGKLNLQNIQSAIGKNPDVLEAMNQQQLLNQK